VLRGLLDQSRDGLVALDEHGTIVEANGAAGAILRHEQRRLIGKPLAAMVALADRKALRYALDHVTPDGEELELRIHTDPQFWTVKLRALPQVDPRTVVVALMPRTRAQRQRAGEGTQRAQRRSDRIEHFALRFPDGVVALRRNGTVAFANARARTLLGAKAVRAGSELGEDVPRDLRSLARRLTQIPAPLHPTIVELENGTALRVSGLAYTNDEPAILFLEDVTDQQRHERVTREFLRNAAHQLRTPLAGIAAAVETLQAGAKERPAERDRFLAHLETHVARLTRIARGLLLLARAQTGEPLRVSYIELGPLLDQTAREVEPHNGVEVATFYEQGVAALASPELLRETLAALVENAVAYTDSGTVRLTAHAENGHVAVAVTDTGRGILPEFRSRVFEPFFRLGDDSKGYGLGLAIAAQAVKAMDGTIDVSDAPGGGTTFTVRLPPFPGGGVNRLRSSP
jgi:signal transduction histidine kinase